MQLLQLNSLDLMKAVLAGQYKIINIPFYWSGGTPEVKTWHMGLSWISLKILNIYAFPIDTCHHPGLCH